MVGACRSRTLRRVQRKAKKHQSTDALEQLLCRSLGGHSSSHGLASRKQRQARKRLCSHAHRTRNRRREDRGQVGGPPTLLHVRKVVSECGHANGGEFVCEL